MTIDNRTFFSENFSSSYLNTRSFQADTANICSFAGTVYLFSIIVAVNTLGYNFQVKLILYQGSLMKIYGTFISFVTNFILSHI